MRAVRQPSAPDAPAPPAGFIERLGGPRSAAADLERFAALLAEKNRRMSLVGRSTIPDFWNRHVLDSAQLLDIAPTAKRWADVGSGAGFPGLVLAILLKKSSGREIHLIECAQKKASFLAGVVSELQLPARVHAVRAETLSFPVDVVTARACAPLSKLLAFSWGFLRLGARGLFLKGESYEAEIEDARRDWRFDCQAIVSRTSPGARVLSVMGVRHGV